MKKSDANRLDTFVYKCPRRILQFHWPMWVTKDEIQRGVEVKNTTPVMALHRPCSVNGAKLGPTCMWH